MPVNGQKLQESCVLLLGVRLRLIVGRGLSRDAVCWVSFTEEPFSQRRSFLSSTLIFHISLPSVMLFHMVGMLFLLIHFFFFFNVVKYSCSLAPLEKKLIAGLGQGKQGK